MSSEKQIMEPPKTMPCLDCLGTGAALTPDPKRAGHFHAEMKDCPTCCGKGEIEFPEVKE